MKFVRFSALLVLGLVFLGLSAHISVNAQGGKTFVAATHEDLKGANSYVSATSGANNTVWNAYVWGGTHTSLYGVTELGFNPFPALAADFAPNSAFKKEGNLFVQTIKLLKNVKWSDGSDVSAQDVAFSYNILLTPLTSGANAGSTLAQAIGYGTPNPDYVDHVEAVDGSTVKFFMKQVPGLGTWELGTLQAALFQEKYWKDKFAAALASAEPATTLIGTAATDEPSAGPFKFKQWQPGAFSEVAANSNYSFKGRTATEFDGGGYKETLPANLGGITRSTGDTSAAVRVQLTEGPHVDGVLYNLFGSQQLGALAVINGDADYAFNPLGYGLATLRQLEAAANVKVFKSPDRGVFYLSFNMRKAPFNFLNFRRAVRCVVDKEFVANQLLAGLVLPTYTPVSAVFGASHRELTEEDRAEACIGMSEADRLARATQLLKDEGFQFNSSGQLAKDPSGNAISEIQLLHPNAAYDNNRNIFGLHIVDRLQKLGVPVRDVPAGFNNIVTLVFSQQDFDMWQLGWRFDGALPFFLWDLFNSVNNTPPNAAAQGGVCSPREDAVNGCQQKFDELSNQLIAETDLVKLSQEAVELQKMIFDFTAYVETHNLQLTEPYRTDRVDWQGIEKDPAVPGGLQGGNGFRAYVMKK